MFNKKLLKMHLIENKNQMGTESFRLQTNQLTVKK